MIWWIIACVFMFCTCAADDLVTAIICMILTIVFITIAFETESKKNGKAK